MSKVRYGKLYETLWLDEDFMKLSAEAKTLYFYLISCHEANSIGFFICGVGYINTFLHQTDDKTKKYLKELNDSKIVMVQEPWILIPKFLKWNTFDNNSAAKGSGETFDKILMFNPPKHFVKTFYENAMKYIPQDDKDFSEDFISKVSQGRLDKYLQGVDRVSTGCQESIDKVSTECRPLEEVKLVTRRSETSRSEKGISEDPFATFAQGNEDLLKALKGFEEMRKAIKKPFASDYAKQTFLKKLEKFDKNSWVAVLDQSTANSWQGIFPISKGYAATSCSSPKAINEFFSNDPDKYESYEDGSFDL